MPHSEDKVLWGFMEVTVSSHWGTRGAFIEDMEFELIRVDGEDFDHEQRPA